MGQHVVRVALIVHGDGDGIGEGGAGPGHTRAIDPERRALAGSESPRSEALVLEHHPPGRDGARRARGRHGHRERVVQDRLRFVDDRGREVLEGQPGNELTELGGERLRVHGGRLLGLDLTVPFGWD
jgi:hypothetical protein